MMPEEQPEPFFVPHKTGQRMLGIGPSKYWQLVRLGKIEVVGRGKGSRGYFASIKAYAEQLVAEAKSRKAV